MSPTTSHSRDRTRRRTVLNLGCGGAELRQDRFPAEEWNEIRVDLDPVVDPDVIADIRELPFENESADAIYCHSCLEHVRETDLAIVLREFNRVLRPGGELYVAVPDLQEVARVIADDQLTEVLYESPAGPVRALDVVYGLASHTAVRPLMSHQTGFTATALSTWLSAAGFDGDVTHWPCFILWAQARKTQAPESLSAGDRLFTTPTRG